jgi:hypothetical protein
MRQMHRVSMVVVAVVVVVAAGCARVDPGQARGNQAYSDRLTGQAVAQQQAAERSARARAAWSQSLNAQYAAYREAQARAERASSAWSLRLTELAHSLGDGGMTDAAAQAWTDRLNGLAGR